MLTLRYGDLIDHHRGDDIDGRRYEWRCIVRGATEEDLTCVRCAECGGAIDAIHDLSTVSISHDLNPMRKYANLLPLNTRTKGRWLGEGNTECRHAERLGNHLGLGMLFLKDETANPTKSTKDRAAAVALARFSELKVTELALASTGNTSTAFARAAAMYGDEFRLHIFVGREFLSRLNYEDHCTVETYVVDSGFDSAGEAARRFARDNGVTFEAGFFNPGRREGLKLAYLECFEQLPQAPRYVFQAVSSGMGLLGAYKGAVEYQRLGKLTRIPSFVAVQQESCSPMARAFSERADLIESRHIEKRPTGVAHAILRGDPSRTYPYINALCRSSGGSIVSVTTAEILSARTLLAELEGVSACNASAAAVAGMIRLHADGLLPADAPVLVNLAGGDRPPSPVPRRVKEYDLSAAATEEAGL